MKGLLSGNEMQPVNDPLLPGNEMLAGEGAAVRNGVGYGHNDRDATSRSPGVHTPRRQAAS